jgi:hypothetical protein
MLMGGRSVMRTLGCCAGDELPGPLNQRQRSARTVVGIASLSMMTLAVRRSGVLGVLGAAGAGWFGASHLVAARTGYAGCPELGAIPSLVLRREVHVGCVPWRTVDRRLGLSA